MTNKLCFALVVLLSCAGLSCSPSATSVLQSATQAMGDVTSIQYSGTGRLSALGQSHTPDAEWPATLVTAYTRTIDYSSRSAREELTRVEQTPPIRGGGAAFAGEQRQVNLVSGDFAWNQPGEAPQPALAAAGERQLQIWLTPHGFLKAALENNPTISQGPEGTVVSFTTGRFKVNGTIDGQNMVSKTETWIPHPVLGDMWVETTYSGYADFNGVKFPAVIVQKQGGYAVLDLAVTGVQPNAGLTLSVPEAVRSATPPPINVRSQNLGDGLWWIAGGSHHSVLAEFPEYLVVIEAPQTEARSLAVIAEAKRLAPNKPIRYLINTHHHFDHSGGVRTYVAEGATIITSEINRPFYERVWSTPRTLEPDRLSQNPRMPEFLTVTDKHVLSEGGQSLEIYHRDDDNHNAGMLMVYFPRPRVLVEADDFTPPAPNAPPMPPRAHGFTVALYQHIQRLGLNVVTIAPLHGAVAPFATLRRAATT
jgi:glyoxylase-like metal-dependent hydrolase (beta-lactamase superfamily II)